MENQDAPFEIVYEKQTLKVEIIRSGKSVVYKITNDKKPGVFFVTRAMDAEKKFFWTSLPEGRQEHAARIGLLIEEKIKL
jgi:ribosomal protein L18